MGNSRFRGPGGHRWALEEQRDGKGGGRKKASERRSIFLLMLESLRDFRRRNCVLPPGAQQFEGSLMHQAAVAQTPEGKLRAWVEENYTHVPLRDKDQARCSLCRIHWGTVPPVHVGALGKNSLARMLEASFKGIGPHRGSDGTRGNLPTALSAPWHFWQERWHFLCCWRSL
jgi:hypothetical protein